MEGWTFWIVAVIASLLVGMGKGGLPMIAMMAVPVLSLVIHPIEAAGLLLPVYVVSDQFGLFAYRREFDKRVLMIVVPGMLFGIGVAWATASFVPETVITGLVGLIGVTFALNSLIRRNVEVAEKQAEVASGLFWGTLTGIASFIVHSGSPPFQVYTLPLKMPKAVFAGTATIAFAIANAVKLVPYYFMGELDLSNLKIAAILMIPASLAVFAGVWLVKVLPEIIFYRVITWALLAVSSKLLWDALSSIV